METGLEIERKFLVSEVPELAGLEIKRIWQGYLTSESAPVEVRIRVVSGGSACVTAKEAVPGTVGVRHEEETDVPPGVAQLLQRACGDQYLEKVRHLIPLGDVTAELDVYLSPADFPSAVEVEFPDADSARAFVPPSWFGAEVTGQDAYTNRHIASLGR